jgi:histone deacetylase 1/2
VFYDVWRPALAYARISKYYVSFIDDYTKFTWIYLLKNKYDVFHKFHDFQRRNECLFDKKIVSDKKDWGGEYQKLNSFFQRVGISHLVLVLMCIIKTVPLSVSIDIVEVGLSLLMCASMPLK